MVARMMARPGRMPWVPGPWRLAQRPSQHAARPGPALRGSGDGSCRRRTDGSGRDLSHRRSLLFRLRRRRSVWLAADGPCRSLAACAAFGRWPVGRCRTSLRTFIRYIAVLAATWVCPLGGSRVHGPGVRGLRLVGRQNGRCGRVVVRSHETSFASAPPAATQTARSGSENQHMVVSESGAQASGAQEAVQAGFFSGRRNGLARGFSSIAALLVVGSLTGCSSHERNEPGQLVASAGGRKDRRGTAGAARCRSGLSESCHRPRQAGAAGQGRDEETDGFADRGPHQRAARRAGGAAWPIRPRPARRRRCSASARRRPRRLR